MESAAVAHEGAVIREDKGLKSGAIGYLSNLVIAVASVAPAYSLAATLGFIVAVKGVGLHAPAVLLVSFIPMLFIASAYNYMNVPVLGAAILAAVFVKALHHYSQAGFNYSKPILGIQTVGRTSRPWYAHARACRSRFDFTFFSSSPLGGNSAWRPRSRELNEKN